LKSLHRTLTILALAGVDALPLRVIVMTSRQLLAVIGLLAVLVATTLFVKLKETDESSGAVAPSAVASSAPAIDNLRSTSRTEVISRLREVLRIREEAYRSRSSDMLSSIYARDCPCLSSDGNAIDELLRKKRIWDGVRTSIEVREVTKLNERVWTVVGLFRSEILYVRTEDGRLVGTEPAGKDLFRFTLVKPEDEQDWLLGLVSVLQRSLDEDDS
jgi:hypothetical protein